MEAEREVHEKNWLEYLVFGFSLLIIISIIVYLILLMSRGMDTPPDLTLSYADDVEKPGQIKVHVENKGGTSVESLHVKAFRPNGDVYTELIFEFVPAHSFREGFVVKDTAAPALHLQITGFQEM